MKSSRLKRSIKHIIDKKRLPTQKIKLPQIARSISPNRKQSFNPCYFHKIFLQNSTQNISLIKQNKNSFISHIVKTQQSILQRARDFYTSMVNKIQVNQKKRERFLENSSMKSKGNQTQNIYPNRVIKSQFNKNRQERHQNPQNVPNLKNIKIFYNKLRFNSENRISHIRKGSLASNLQNKVQINLNEYQNIIGKTQSLASEINCQSKSNKKSEQTILNTYVAKQQFKPRGCVVKTEGRQCIKKNVRKFIEKKKTVTKLKQNTKNQIKLNDNLNGWDYISHLEMEQQY